MVSTITLKNAARAIEHDLWTDTSGANYLVKDGAILRRWDPETSSADSFELMVALTIHVRVCKKSSFADMRGLKAYSANDGDSRKAARYVILDVASQIGLAMYSPENT